MRRVQRTALILAVTAFLSACGAPRPVSYYILDVAPAAAPAGAAQQFPVSLSVGRIVTTHLYHDDRLVFGSGPVELGTYEYERWAEPPADMVQDILISSLRSSGQYRSVSRMNSAVRADYIIRGHLFALYEADKPKLVGRFSMQLELVDPKSGMTIWTDTYSQDEPVNGKKVQDVVEALDTVVRGGIQHLVGGLGDYFAAHPPQQPTGH